MAKLSLEQLRQLRDSKKNDLRRRESAGKDIQIIVAMGTCGIAAGAKNTLDAFIHAIDTENLVDTVLIRQSGCMGLCSSEPTVEVVVPGMPTVTYGTVDTKIAGEIVKKHIIGRELLDAHMLNQIPVNVR
jgi:NADP-reducing hydrogenase subunit HndB